VKSIFEIDWWNCVQKYFYIKRDILLFLPWNLKVHKYILDGHYPRKLKKPIFHLLEAYFVSLGNPESKKTLYLHFLEIYFKHVILQYH
jgi:hypothetical protein